MYVVKVVLLPQDVTKAEVKVALDRHYDTRTGVVYSADDAAQLVAEGLPGSRVIVYDAERWTGGNIAHWLQERGVSFVEFARFETVWPDK